MQRTPSTPIKIANTPTKTASTPTKTASMPNIDLRCFVAWQFCVANLSIFLAYNLQAASLWQFLENLASKACFGGWGFGEKKLKVSSTAPRRLSIFSLQNQVRTIFPVRHSGFGSTSNVWGKIVCFPGNFSFSFYFKWVYLEWPDKTGSKFWFQNICEKIWLLELVQASKR